MRQRWPLVHAEYFGDCSRHKLGHRRRRYGERRACATEKAVEEIDFDEEEGERGMLVARLRPPGTLDWLPSDEKRAQAIAARGQWPFDVLHTDGDQEDLDEAQTRAALDALEQCTSKRKAPCSTPSSSKAPSQPKKPKLDQVDVAPAAESHPDDGVGATGRPGRKSADRAKERFETEDLVWARVKGWHWWPGVITDVAGSKYSVTLFGTAADHSDVERRASLSLRVSRVTLLLL